MSVSDAIGKDRSIEIVVGMVTIVGAMTIISTTIVVVRMKIQGRKRKKEGMKEMEDRF